MDGSDNFYSYQPPTENYGIPPTMEFCQPYGQSPSQIYFGANDQQLDAVKINALAQQAGTRGQEMSMHTQLPATSPQSFQEIPSVTALQSLKRQKQNSEAQQRFRLKKAKESRELADQNRSLQNENSDLKGRIQILETENEILQDENEDLKKRLARGG